MRRPPGAPGATHLFVTDLPASFEAGVRRFLGSGFDSVTAVDL